MNQQMIRITGIENQVGASAWCRRYGFSHRQLGDELRIYGLIGKEKWYAAFLADTGIVDEFIQVGAPK